VESYWKEAYNITNSNEKMAMCWSCCEEREESIEKQTLG
jgi:hypothetical protein